LRIVVGAKAGAATNRRRLKPKYLDLVAGSARPRIGAGDGGDRRAACVGRLMSGRADQLLEPADGRPDAPRERHAGRPSEQLSGAGNVGPPALRIVGGER